ncbi:hypothetical protein J2S09_005539 [Bacillus fengqiuensis]|nr:hypothetical protein [Bacillus fengqiuensis]
MEMYTKAYNMYMEKCEKFGLEGIDFIEFIRNTTTEQIQNMLGDIH